MASCDNYIEFDLNSAITGVDKDGKWREDLHERVIDPVFKRIKQHDGVTKCFIGRYTVKIYYRPNILTVDDVYEIAREAIEWGAANVESLFPCRGDKRPTVVRDKATRSIPNALLIKWSSHVTAYIPSAKNPEVVDTAAINKARYELTRRLADVDGVLHIVMFADGVRVRVDTRVTTLDRVQAHLVKVLMACKPANKVPDTGMDKIFPYITSSNELFLTVEPYREH